MTEEYKPARDLHAGDHTLNSHGVHRVVGIYDYQDADGDRAVAATMHPVGLGSDGPWILRVKASAPVQMASAANIERAVEAARRDIVDQALGRVVRTIHNANLPVPAYQTVLQIGLGSVAELQQWAEAFGGRVREERRGGRIHRAAVVDIGGQDVASVELHLICPPTDADEPEPEPVQEWLFTFGSGQRFDGRFVRIGGTYRSARAQMIATFGTAWCDQYDWRRFDALGLLESMTELPESEWPTTATDATAPTGGDR
ncbi:hypothetical protein ABT336_00415 [Micromonospora sp. NPDC000207]|uniref:hypothetical protein n=1 Tax=Micromonospora sp. NPDC000207 TaxID=3154246 RepID=UPI00332BCCFD